MGGTKTEWKRYTERALKVMLHAEDWAIRLGSPYISTEHILLGLLEETDTIACEIFKLLSFTLSLRCTAD